MIQPVLADMQLYPGRDSASSFVVGPVLKDGVMIGVVALELDGPTIFRSFNTYFGLGETGDATVAMREGDEITYVAPSRFNPSAAFRDRLRIGSAIGKDMQLAVTGNRGFGEMADHTGKSVVTAWTYLPSFRWGIAVKQDSDEAFELLWKQRQAIAAFMAVAGLCGLLRRPGRGAVDLPADPRRRRRWPQRVASGDLTARVTEIAPRARPASSSGRSRR